MAETLSAEEKAQGKKLVTPEELKEQYDSVVVATGIYDNARARGLGIANEIGKDVLQAEDFLRQVLPAIKEGRINDFVLDVAGEKLTLSELSQRKIYVTGVGYTGHDVVRSLMQMLSMGDANDFNGHIHWLARRADLNDYDHWPAIVHLNESEPTIKMVRYLQSLNKDIHDEHLLYIDDLERNSDGNISTISLAIRQLLNPEVAEVSPGKAHYQTASRKTISFSDAEKPLIIVATGYDIKKQSPLLKSFGFMQEGFPGKNYHAGYDMSSETAFFLSGNMSIDHSSKADEVVNAIQYGTLAAEHVKQYMQKAMQDHMSASTKGKIFCDNAKENTFLPKDIMSKKNTSGLFASFIMAQNKTELKKCEDGVSF